MRNERCGSPRRDSRAVTRSRPRVTRRRRSSSSVMLAKRCCGLKEALLEILFEPPREGLEHAAVRVQLLALAGDDLPRGALDELIVGELSAGALDLALDARDLTPQAFDLPAPELLCERELDHHVPGRQRRLRRAVERLEGPDVG